MLKKKLTTAIVMISLCAAVASLSSCSAIDAINDKVSGLAAGNAHATVNEDESAPDRNDTPKILTNEAPGKKTFGANGATVDYSNINDGYVMVKYEGNNPKVKVVVTNTADSSTHYTYDLNSNGEFNALPLTLGGGEYNVAVYTNISGDKYAAACQQNISMKLKDEFSPHLRPSQYVNYDASSKCVSKAEEVVKDMKDDLGAAEQIFLYVVANTTYDYDKAKTVQPGYLPVVDETLDTGKGICFDFAALTVAMLRSQGIPSKLVIGYAGSAYHSWISIYSKESGEFAAIIEFVGDKYNYADPTFTASGADADPNVVGDGATYKPLYYY